MGCVGAIHSYRVQQNSTHIMLWFKMMPTSDGVRYNAIMSSEQAKCHRRVGHDSKQTSLGVFRPLSVRNQVLYFRLKERTLQGGDIDIPRTGDSTWSLRDSKRWLIYSCPYKRTQTKSHLDLSRLVLKWWCHTESSTPATSYYVTLCHTMSYKPGISSHREPPVSFWAPVSPPSYPRLVWPTRRPWSRWHKM